MVFQDTVFQLIFVTLNMFVVYLSPVKKCIMKLILISCNFGEKGE